ncbi:hypothetical protein R1sor_014582 [Riccia sorocarpa]|uniref:F-box domain-containing protein n=1 Tax=Riccia sorocarpa TaxID=122646 RepID=A0ABD3HA22_9MARC
MYQTIVYQIHFERANAILRFLGIEKTSFSDMAGKSQKAAIVKENSLTKSGEQDDNLTLLHEYENIWTQLPEHILRKISIRLPVPQLLQLKTVCKQWKQLLDSPDFWRLRSEIPSSEETNFLVLQMNCSFLNTADDWITLDDTEFAVHSLNIHDLSMYNPFLRNWYRLPPSTLTQREIFCRSYHRGVWCIQVLSKKRKRLDDDELRIEVHHPTSGWRREIPNTFGPKLRILLSLVVDNETNNFKLITTGCADSEWTCTHASCVHTQVYDSVSQRWTTAGDLPTSILLFKTNGRFNVMQIVIGHRVYYMVTRVSTEFAASNPLDEAPDDDSQLTWTFLSFNLRDNRWTLIDGRIPFTDVMHFRTITFERNEEIVVAQLTSTSSYEWRSSLGWKLRVYTWDTQRNPNFLVWREVPVCSPPEDEGLPKLFYRQRSHRFAGSWTGQGDFIIFVSGSCWGHRALLYNITSKAWTVTDFGPRLTKQPLLFITMPFDLTLNMSSIDHGY